MKTRSIILVLILAMAGGVTAHAQSLGATQITLKLDGQTFGGVLVPPTGAVAGYTWTLPPQSGTIALSSSGGWQVGGQGLLPTNPGLLGSTDAADVSLIAGGTGNVRMTILNSASAVLLPAQTELRLGDAAGTEYSAWKSPATLKTSNITYVLPDTLPGGPDVRLRVAGISGNTVTLAYTNPATTGQIGFNGSGAQTCNTSTVSNVDVAGITFTVGPNAIYSFEAFLDILDPGSNADITWGSTGTDTDPAGTTIKYKVFNLTDNGNDEAGGTESNVLTVDAGDVSLVKGYIQTDGTTPANSVVVLRMKKGASGTEACLTAKSAVQLVTE